MNKTVQTTGPEGLSENLFRNDLIKIKDELAQAVIRVKAHKLDRPFPRDMMEIIVRIPNSLYKFRNEFNFSQIESGFGVLRILEEWVAGLEKHDKNAQLVVEAYLFPYRQQSGRKVIGRRIVKGLLEPTHELLIPPMETVAPPVVVETRKKTRLKIAKVVEVIEVITKAEESVTNPENKEIDVTEIIMPVEAALPIEIEETVIVSPNNDEAAEQPEQEWIVAELLAQTQANLSKTEEEWAPTQRNLSETKEEGPTEIFLQSPIDFDYRQWELWERDVTRKILKKTFMEHEIVSPADLMWFLGMNNPTKQEWEGFIAELNDHRLAGPKLKVGPSSEASLKRWMRKHKLIPKDFKEI
jgi:hypothetical protein